VTQPHPGDVVALGVQDVEHVEEDGHARTAGSLRVAELHPALQTCEARPSPIERNDLAVHDEAG
jgi:hypothetical protein